MVCQRKLPSLVIWILTSMSAAASAQTLGQTEVFLSFGDDEPVTRFFSADEATRSGSAGMDYATFAYELIAFVTKEVLPDAHDEYPESPLGSHLSRDMTERGSDFGRHCLIVVSRVGAVVPSFSGASRFAIGSISGVDLVRVASTALALRQIWSAFKNDVGDNRRSLSLHPKVGTRKVGVNLTFHW